VRLERTHQLNVGGNTDFMNMLERERLESKKISKTNAVTSQLDYDIGARNVHIGPSDYVEWLDDRKWAYIRMEGRSFGDVPLNIELKLEVIDSPNSAGIVIDAVRCAKLALDDGLAGALEWPSAYFMKSPPVQHADDECRDDPDYAWCREHPGFVWLGERSDQEAARLILCADVGIVHDDQRVLAAQLQLSARQV